MWWKRRMVPLTCIVVSLIFDAIFLAVDQSWNLPVTTSAGLLSASMLPLAVMFYWVRCVHRLIYGLVELIMALGAAFFVLLSMAQKVTSNEITMQLITGRTIALVAVAYFIVRALDNIGEGLKPGSPAASRWNALFPKPPK